MSLSLSLLLDDLRTVGSVDLLTGGSEPVYGIARALVGGTGEVN